MSFEKGLAELERIVAKLESSDVDLETAVADFEQGIKIQKYCKKKLDEATLQVNRLLGCFSCATSDESTEASFRGRRRGVCASIPTAFSTWRGSRRRPVLW